MKKEMLINVLQPEECRIAIVEDGTLEELYVERASQESYVGNIYKGRIVNIEPSIQAVFVDFGIGRNGFLHVSDVDPVYYKHLLPKHVQDEMDADDEDRPPPRRDRGDRGDRRDRGDRGDRQPPRFAEAEEVTTAERTPAPAFPEDEDEGGFGAGLDSEVEAPAARPEPRPEPRVERRPEPVRPASPPPPPAEPEFADDDGFGSGLLDDEPEPTPVARRQPEPEPAADAGESEPTVALTPAAETEEKPAKPKAKSRTRTKKADDAEGEGEKKPKARRTRKKADAEGGEAPEASGGDEQPRPMPGAERRTDPSDDEPEIAPFFGGGGGDFDPDAPNDRFAPSLDDDAGEPPPMDAPVAFDEGEEEGEADAEPVFAERGPVGEPAEDDEFAPPPRRSYEDDRGGRRGDRTRGRDRGPGRRGDRDRGDRGGPRGGFGGGGRGGPPARDRGYPRPPIQEIFKRGQEVIIQVIKEGIGTKGPTLSTFISIAGRYLVLMPSLNRVGVSRKIEDIDARKRLREIMTKLEPPKGVGFIVRTAAIDRNEKELQNDLAYLLRLWQVVVKRIKKVAAPVEIYRESDMITRTIRDNFTADIDTIYVDEPNAFAHASEFLQIVMPRFADRIRFHADTEPLFNKYRVEDEIQKINHKRIDMPQGGSIIIEQTEALVAIDVNSGNFRADNRDAEETAFRMNLLAAKEIARQLRLRDLGGVIVNDFIDMRDIDHRRKVEDALRDALKRDKARTKILRISQFGIIEMTRQRIQPSLKKRIYNDCQHCKGTGYVKTQETMGIEVMRLLQLAAHRSPQVSTVSLTVHMDVAFYLLNRKRKDIAALEEKGKMDIQVQGQLGASPDLLEAKAFDNNGNEVRLLPAALPPRFGRGGPPPRENERRYPRPLD
ncbi:MAG: Rne/Rng family ribonuclease [Gemmataceae bacterium]